MEGGRTTQDVTGEGPEGNFTELIGFIPLVTEVLDDIKGFAEIVSVVVVVPARLLTVGFDKPFKPIGIEVFSEKEAEVFTLGFVYKVISPWLY